MAFQNKNLGQHFLNDQYVLESIAEYLRTNNTCKKVLEVGPGMGVLTEKLIQLDQFDLYLNELDGRFPPLLLKKFPSLEGKIIHQDFLQLNLKEHFSEPLAVVGNFPYNISTQIVFKIIEDKEQIPFMLGMFQKEVARRITAPHGNKAYGILSVLTQAFYETEYLFEIPPTAFNPPPKVFSAMIVLKRKKNLNLTCEEATLKKVVKAGFNQRRKMLSNALKSILPDVSFIPEETLKKRAEALSVEDFINLSQLIEQHGKR